MRHPFPRSAARPPLVALLLVAVLFATFLVPFAATPRQAVIVQGPSVEAARVAVLWAGGAAERELDIIDGVSTRLSARAIARLEQTGFRVMADHPVRASDDDSTSHSGNESGTNGLELYPSAAVEAHTLLDQNIDGRGVTIAFVDSGFAPMASAGDWQRNIDNRTLYAENSGRFVVYRDLLHGNGRMRNSSDPYGHGTHVVMTVADNREAEPGPNLNDVPVSVAPRANLVIVRALDATGQGTYSTVIDAIDWIVANRAAYNVRVLNLSLDGVIAAPYWVDPLGQAVMRAWAEGLTVVAAAGNGGPAPMTIGVPGNVPYIITVGAIKSGRYTESTFDELATYSSAGPTESKFIKPDVLVPASRTIAALPLLSGLVLSGAAGLVHEAQTPILGVGALRPDIAYYKVSGTSMAAAEVSGIVALILQRNPTLTNNQIKYRLTSTALAAGSPDGAQYSVWQQGAGRVDTLAAVNGASTQAANAGMDIHLDKLGDVPGALHYLGPSAFDAATNSFYIEGQPVNGGGFQTWGGGFQTWGGGFQTWGGGFQTWGGGFQTWGGGFQTWGGSYQAWGGSFQTWGGGFQTWGGGFQTWGGSLVQDD